MAKYLDFRQNLALRPQGSEGKAETLRKILAKRLGPLPKTVTTLIGRLDFLQLEKLAVEAVAGVV